MELNYTDLVFSIIFGAIIWLSYKGYTAPLHDKYLTCWPRFWAPTIDELVLWVPASLLPYMIYELLNLTGDELNLLYASSVLIFFLYSIYFHGTFGATIGKMTTGVKVVDAKTEKGISYYQAFIRDSIPIGLCIAIAL